MHCRYTCIHMCAHTYSGACLHATPDSHTCTRGCMDTHYIYIYIQVYMQVHTCTHTHTHTHTHTRVHIHMQWCTHILHHTHTLTCTHACMHTCARMHTHAHRHTHRAWELAWLSFLLADKWALEERYGFKPLEFGRWELKIPPNDDGSCPIQHLSKLKVLSVSLVSGLLLYCHRFCAKQISISERKMTQKKLMQSTTTSSCNANNNAYILYALSQFLHHPLLYLLLLIILCRSIVHSWADTLHFTCVLLFF